MEHLQLGFSSSQQTQITSLICLHSWRSHLLHQTHLWFYFSEAFSLKIGKDTFCWSTEMNEFCNFQPQFVEKCIQSPETLLQLANGSFNSAKAKEPSQLILQGSSWSLCKSWGRSTLVCLGNRKEDRSAGHEVHPTWQGWRDLEEIHQRETENGSIQRPWNITSAKPHQTALPLTPLLQGQIPLCCDSPGGCRSSYINSSEQQAQRPELAALEPSTKPLPQSHLTALTAIGETPAVQICSSGPSGMPAAASQVHQHFLQKHLLNF